MPQSAPTKNGERFKTADIYADATGTGQTSGSSRIHVMIMKREQGWIVAKVTSVAVACSLFSYFGANYLIQLTSSKMESANIFTAAQVEQVKVILSESTLTMISISSILGLVYALYMGVFLSYKIAGPVFKVIQHLKEKRTEKIHLRRGDYFAELAAVVNEGE